MAEVILAREVETFRGAVFPWEIDVMGHMNVRYYIAKYDDATLQFFGMLGLTIDYFRSENRAMGAVQQNLSYRRELFAGDLVVVRTSIVELGARKLHFLHRMHEALGDAEVATAEMIGVHFDRQTHRATPFPEKILAAGKALLD